MTKIYKINEVYRKGKLVEIIYATEPDAKWLDSTCLMIKIGKKITLFYGHKRLSNLDPVILTKKQFFSLSKLLNFWNKRKMIYAKWQYFGAMYVGILGYFYAKPFSNKIIKLGKNAKPEEKIVDKKEIIKGYHKKKEIFVKNELSAEQFYWEKYYVELSRDEITIMGKGQGLIIPQYELKNFKEFMHLIDFSEKTILK